MPQELEQVMDVIWYNYKEELASFIKDVLVNLNINRASSDDLDLKEILTRIGYQNDDYEIFVTNNFNHYGLLMIIGDFFISSIDEFFNGNYVRKYKKFNLLYTKEEFIKQYDSYLNMDSSLYFDLYQENNKIKIEKELCAYIGNKEE